MSEEAPYVQGHMLFKACGRCSGDMSFQTFINFGHRTHDFTCLQCGNVVPIAKAQYDLTMADRLGKPIILLP